MHFYTLSSYLIRRTQGRDAPVKNSLTQGTRIHYRQTQRSTAEESSRMPANTLKRRRHTLPHSLLCHSPPQPLTLHSYSPHTRALTLLRSYSPHTIYTDTDPHAYTSHPHSYSPHHILSGTLTHTHTFPSMLPLTPHYTLSPTAPFPHPHMHTQSSHSPPRHAHAFPHTHT